MTTKREQWRLPKTYAVKRLKKGMIQRVDGEPRLHLLEKHANDRTLSTEVFIECCGCGLTHLHTYNVVHGTTEWYLLTRAYRVPGSGKGKK